MDRHILGEYTKQHKLVNRDLHIHFGTELNRCVRYYHQKCHLVQLGIEEHIILYGLKQKFLQDKSLCINYFNNRQMISTNLCILGHIFEQQYQQGTLLYLHLDSLRRTAYFRYIQTKDLCKLEHIYYFYYLQTT